MESEYRRCYPCGSELFISEYSILLQYLEKNGRFLYINMSMYVYFVEVIQHFPPYAWLDSDITSQNCSMDKNALRGHALGSPVQPSAIGNTLHIKLDLITD